MKTTVTVGLLALAALIALQFLPQAEAASSDTRVLNLVVQRQAVIGTTNEVHRITKSLTADIDYDFASATTTCNDTPAFTATGMQVGDPCFVGIGPRDGGTQVVTANSTFSCFVDAVNTVKLRHCAVGTAANPADAGYVLRVFSSQ